MKVVILKMALILVEQNNGESAGTSPKDMAISEADFGG
jgi:hypothetical protein